MLTVIPNQPVSWLLQRFRDILVPFRRTLVPPTLSHTDFQGGCGCFPKIHRQERESLPNPKSFQSCNRGRLDIENLTLQISQLFLLNRL